MELAAFWIKQKQSAKARKVLDQMPDIEQIKAQYFEIIEQGIPHDFATKVSIYQYIDTIIIEILNLLADCDVLDKNYNNAEIIYTILIEHDNSQLTTFRRLQYLYAQQGNWRQASIFMRRILDIHLKQLAQYYPFMPEKDRLNFYYKTLKPSINELYDLWVKSKDKRLQRKMQEVSLNTKGKAIQTTQQIRDIIAQSGNPQLQQKHEEWTALRDSMDILSKQKMDPFIAHNPAFEQLKIQCQNLEREIAILASKTVASQNFAAQNKIITYYEFNKQLDTNEAAIDFMCFAKNDIIWYYALINKSGLSAPIMVKLTEAKALEHLINQEVGRSSRGELKKSYITVNSLNKLLYELVWQPLEPHLEDIQKIHLCPVGSLHQLSFGSLRFSATNEYLSEKYQFHYYNNLNTLLLQDTTSLNFPKSIHVFGGADFDYIDSSLILPKERAMEMTYNWSFLEGSKAEAEEIESLFTDSITGWNTNIYTGNEASEDTLEYLIKKCPPTILHLATHGFFSPKNTHFIPAGIRLESLRDFIVLHENPLYRSGFVLSGANYVWQGGTLQKGTADGIVTAYDVAGWNLQETELVVLAACKTGRGSIHDIEGVQGLRSAFKQAGARYLLVSLWNIGDSSTKEMMLSFYNYYLSGATIPEAYQNALADFREKYPDPYYWGAFLLIE